jgi:hypothetical protein
MARTRAVQMAGALAAVVLALVVNVIAARHYRRWDWTSSRRYTLSEPTLSTLRALTEPIDVWLISGDAEPSTASLKQLLVSYEAESALVHVHPIDPDRDVLALEDVRRRFKVETGQTEDGRAVADAVLVVARGDRHWLVTPNDLISLPSEDDPKVEPREEAALTGAIREVEGGTKAKLCFTRGHDEPLLSDSGPTGLALLAELLEKSNFDVVQVDPTAPGEHEPFAGCDVVIVAAPRTPFAPAESERLRTYLLGGGSALVAISPLEDPAAGSRTGMVAANLDGALAPFGIGLVDALVVEKDPQRTLPGSRGATFAVLPRPHAVTASLLPAETHDAPRIVLGFVRPLRRETASPVAASDLLVTGDQAYAVSSIAGAAEWTGPPPEQGVLHGAQVVAMAAERAKVSPSAAHGPRLVVVGTGSVFAPANWQEAAPLHGAAFFVESAISWLAARPAIVDVPARPKVTAGLRLSEGSVSDVRSYVLFYMPAAMALLGLAIGLRRRATEGTPRDPAPNTKTKTDRSG